MANLNVTYQELTDVATRLSSGQNEIEQKLSELKSAVDNLINAGFRTDKASGAFGASYEEFTTGVRQTIGGLEGMSGFLKAAAETFTSTDDALASAIRG